MIRKMTIGIGLIVLGIAQAAVFGVGCGGDGHRRAHSAEGEQDRSEREEEANLDLAKAKRANTEEAFRVIIKRHEGTAAADQARSEIARLRSDQARAALADGDRKKARELADEALKTGDSNVAEQARITLEQIDRSDARFAAKTTKELLASGTSLENCHKALTVVASTLGAQPSAVLLRDTRKDTLQPLSACLQAIIDTANDMDGLTQARKVVDSQETRQAIGADTAHALTSALNDRIVQAIAKGVGPDIESNKWESAFATIKKWADSAAAGQQQVEVASQQARDVITKGLLVRGNAVLGQPKAEPMLAEVNRALKLFEGLNVAPELKRLQVNLSAWIECKRLACTAPPKPKMAYTFGASGLLPPESAQSEQPLQALANATKVWPLAIGKGRALVALEDPGETKTWPDRMNAAKGWVDSSILQDQDTALWLPVGKALEKTRVWLPSGRDDKLYLLGMVESVTGKDDVTVKRLSDGQNVTLKRDELRTGNLVRGLKVLANCNDQLRATDARYEEIITLSGVNVARVTCLTQDGKDDKTRDEVLGSLRSKPEWLPPRRP